MKSVVTWFEIPVTDFNRAKKFYETIFNFKLQEQDMMADYRMGFFPMNMDEYASSGTIVKGNGYVPSKTGTLIYINLADDLNEVLNRVEAAGGYTVMPKTLITDDIGYVARFGDTEGNIIALHSKK